MINATFRDSIGTYTIENVAQIVPTGKNLWSVMTADYEEQEVQGELVEILKEGF